MNQAEKMEVGGGGRVPGGLPALHLAVLLFGGAGLFAKWIPASPLTIVLGRVFFATLALGLMLVLLRRNPRLADAPSRWMAAGCGLVLVIHWAAFFQSIQLSTVAVGLLGYATAPLFAALLEPLWFGESFSPRSLAASLISLGGIALVVPQWRTGEAVLQGLGWGLLAGLSFAILSLLNRRLREKNGGLELAFFQDAVAMALLAPFAPLFVTRLEMTDLWLMLLLGVLFTALAHALFIHTLRRVKARMATLAGNLEPLYGIALAAMLLDEIPPIRTLAGGAIVLAAVIWLTLAGDSGRRTVKMKYQGYE